MALRLSEEKELVRRYHRYAHVGCPGVGYEDNCGCPDECAVTGCRVLRDRATLSQHTEGR